MCPEHPSRVYFAKQHWTPSGYQLRFDKEGKAKHTAILCSRERRCYMHADLDQVKEAEI